jgi:hypothetical protein
MRSIVGFSCNQLAINPACILLSIFLDPDALHIAFLAYRACEGAVKVADLMMVRLNSSFDWLSLSGIIVEISHFDCLSLEI